jgi:hypothetical protein
MSLNNNFKKLLKENCLIEVENGNISLKGGANKDKYTVNLTDITDSNVKDISVINFGKGPHSSLIKKESAYCKICDYLILVPQKENKISALFIELKKTYKKKAEQQLYSSIPLLDYIKSMLLTHFDEKYQFYPQFFIIASKISPRLDKQKTRPEPIQKISFKKRKITFIMGDNVPFKKILIK